MSEDYEIYLGQAEEQMQKTIQHLESELSKILAGKANPSLVESIKIDYYGVETPINQVSTVKNLDPRTLVIQPWEKEMLEPIEKSILAANIGITPQNDGTVIRLAMPPLTEERRLDLVKSIKDIGESSRVSIRNTRREANEGFKELAHDGLSKDMAKTAEHKNQDLTDKYIKIVDKHLESKEKEIMTV